jgi:hypothetical protein
MVAVTAVRVRPAGAGAGPTTTAPVLPGLPVLPVGGGPGPVRSVGLRQAVARAATRGAGW